MTSAEETGRHIERLLTELHDSPDPRAAAAGEELTRHLVQLYGDGLARIAGLLGTERLTELCADPLVSSLLLVHDLHPVPAADRIRAVLAGTGVDLLGVDDAGRVRLRATGSRCAVRDVESRVRAAAPEVSSVDVATAPPLLRISLRPGLGHSAS
ncbi:hypothetical protein [Paractinoplanes rishiriensis]|uniref:Thioredoxin n=1 Tax=Paractinoplanes rishiriensis TaxID=1050105 RepID=A0A919MYT1_9ACTN|nr:hypothetical protein [Actinoplanes rishiriensis]GIF00599.1 thioredoxin [Actinoplanes rishiriensis]